jgi:hypothetical protein
LVVALREQRAAATIDIQEGGRGLATAAGHERKAAQAISLHGGRGAPMVENDPDQVEKTRRRLLARAADEHLLVSASHWHPGRVVRKGDAFRFIAKLEPA